MPGAILDPLNDRQREAVTYGEGPLLIVAGVGTGKTTVITRRIAWLIAEKRARPSEILALTFTERAAAEMEARVDLLVPYGYIEATIGTFHGFCDGVLREHAVLLGLDPAFRVLTEAEQIMLLKNHLFDLPLDRFRPLGNPLRHLHALITLFSRAKDEDIAPEAYAAHVAEAQRHGEGDPQHLADHVELAATYAAYQRTLAAQGCVDFGDLIAHVLRLFREHPAALARYRRRYRYILVDEFQDTNHAQFELLRLLGEGGNLNVCGDDDQSIYRFRGAALDNILGFVDAYPSAHRVVLTDNHRSTQPILDAAYRLIQFNNPERLETRIGIDKRLRSIRGDGEPVSPHHFDTLDEESEFVARELVAEQDRGTALQEIAILVRGNAQAEPFLHSLNLQRIPWRFSGSRGLYDQEEIRALTALLRILADPGDDQSLHFVASSPPYAVPGATLAELTARAKRQRTTLLAEMRRALRGAADDELPVVRRLVGDVTTMIDAAATQRTGEVIYRYLTAQTDLLERWSNAATAESAARVQNVAKMFSIVERFARVARYDRVPWFIEYLDDLIEAGDNPPTGEPDPDADALHVLTVHQAKGLEFDVVFMVGLVDGRFPGRHRRDPLELPEGLGSAHAPDDAAAEHRREERRLFYVGMTRARRRLVLTSARDCGGKRERKPSQFVGEALDLPVASRVREKGSPLVTIGRHAPPAEVAVETREPKGASPITLSHERIQSYRRCPRHYRYRHVVGVPARPHHGMIYGQVIHRTIAWYHRTWRSLGERPSLDALTEQYQSLWRSAGYLTAEHERLRFEEGRSALARFHDHAMAETSPPELVEERFAFSEGGVRVVGVFDRVDRSPNGGAVIDYKTSAIEGDEEADAAASRDLQLGIYGLAYAKRFAEPPSSLELHFVTPGRLVVGRTGTAATGPLLGRARWAIAAVAEGVAARRFEATPSRFVCPYCDYNGICPSRMLG
jgi:DNA helicase-2/ATP-dependent DNA helicase PcrA